MKSYETEKLHPIHLIFLTYMLQSSVILFSMPRYVAEIIGTNGWVILLLFSGVVMFNIFLIQLVYKKGEGKTVFDIINRSLPTFFTYTLYALIAIVWALVAVVIAKQYIFIIQIISFPTTPSYYLLSMFMVLPFLLLLHPVYKMVRVSSVFFILAGITILLTVFVWPEFSFERLTTFFFKEADNPWNWNELLNIYSGFLGYEVCLLLIPYITKHSHLFRSFYLGNGFTTFVYVYTVVLCLGFYSFEQIKHVLYPTLHFFSYIEFPFLIRVENLVYSLFLVKALVTVTFFYWMSSEAVQQIIKVNKPSYLHISIIVMSILLTAPFNTRQEMEKVISFTGKAEMAIAFFLPLLLLLLLRRKRKVLV
ncbi:GerAB/ArcD/ProY family transporter [Alteribacillus bidgolensis]|uniref:Spore germination protein n=1 Tax=Alteribacillus bidgolensis TaxID=930129 RepID=A0A1G8IC44_9BACI|nr:GerAB/ArcD/ProY family transporter [Alteribacillus bidgolensis]SDI16549.1 Spore germination protein [Alteribacillus bidgolensis]